MAKRVTIMIQDELDRSIRQYQASKIQATRKGYSYSHAVNDLLADSI